MIHEFLPKVYGKKLRQFEILEAYNSVVWVPCSMLMATFLHPGCPTGTITSRWQLTQMVYIWTICIGLMRDLKTLSVKASLFFANKVKGRRKQSVSKDAAKSFPQKSSPSCCSNGVGW